MKLKPFGMITSKPEQFVLIRGLLREQRHWGEFVQLLQKAFPTSKILTLDIPGNGSLNHLTSGRSIAGLTDALRRQIKPNIKLNLIAISMGAMIAIDWMTRHSNEIKSAALINTSLCNYSPFYQRLRWQVYPQIIEFPFLNNQAKERLILKLTSNKRQNDELLLQEWQQWRQEYPISKTSAVNQLIAAARFSAPQKPKQPVLIIASKVDRLVNYQCSLRLKHMWQCSYHEHSSAGHDLPLDEPGWLVEKIKQWQLSH